MTTPRQRIKELRIERRWSQHQLASRADVLVHLVERIENDAQPLPFGAFGACAAALGYDVDEWWDTLEGETRATP